MRYVAMVLAVVLSIGATVGAQEPAADPARAAFDAGTEAYGAGRYDDAKAQFLEALKGYAGDHVVLTWLGTTCHALRQWDEAIDYLTQAAEANPEYAVAQNNLGNAYLEKGLPLLKEAATEAQGRELVGTAVGRYEKALALKADYLYAAYNAAQAYAALREWDKAWKAFHTATSLGPNDVDVWRSFGRALKQAGELDKAVERYEKAAELDPRCLECFVQLGWIYSKQARWPEAERAYARAVAADAENFDAQLGLGIALYSQRKYADAKAPLTKAGQLKPESFEAHYNLGLVADALNDAPGAEAAYRAATAIKGDDAPGLNNLGVAVFNQGKPCEAVPHFQAAAAADDTYVMAHINLALGLEACGKDLDAALKQWRDAVAKFPRQASARCGLANALYRAGHVNEALAEYLRCLELDADNLDAHNNVGLIYLDRDQLVDAAAHFRQALAINPNYVPAMNNLGVTYEKQGKVNEAKEMYQKALAIDPTYDKARENLDRLNKPAGGG